MTHGFDKDYWEQHWRPGRDAGPGPLAGTEPNPYLARELGGLRPGTALDAGCGAGAEAIWLAAQGWRVTAADISSQALAQAAARESANGVGARVAWVEADLSTWQPDMQFDLVTTHYAHPATPQLEFYDRIAGWVAPGGTLLIVGHRQTAGSAGHGENQSPDHGPDNGPDHGHGHGHGQEHEAPAEASVTAAGIAARLHDATWDVVTADEPDRTTGGADGRRVTVHDVVVRATRRRSP